MQFLKIHKFQPKKLALKLKVQLSESISQNLSICIITVKIFTIQFFYALQKTPKLISASFNFTSQQPTLFELFTLEKPPIKIQMPRKQSVNSSPAKTLVPSWLPNCPKNIHKWSVAAFLRRRGRWKGAAIFWLSRKNT